MSHYQHRYPWSSLATPPYRPLVPAGPQGYISYRHRATVCRFELVVLPWHVHEKGSTGVYHLWADPCFSSSVWFFEHWGQGSYLRRTSPFFTRVKSDAVWTCGLRVGHGYLSMAVFIFIHRGHPYRWAAIVPQLN